MTTLLIVRHGQSTANLDSIFAGHYDIPLAPLGITQAQRTAAYIAANYHADAVYSSDLQRAKATAEIIAGQLHLPVQFDEGLREVCAGEWEGKTFDYLVENAGEAYRKWRFDIGNAVCPGGESCADTQRRVVRTVKRIARENEGKTVIITSHGVAIRTLMCHILADSLDAMKDIPWVSNASVTTVIADGDTLRIEKASYDEHLAGIQTVLPPNV